MASGFRAALSGRRFCTFALTAVFGVSCASGQEAAVVLPDAPGMVSGSLSSSSSSSSEGAPVQEQEKKPASPDQSTPGGPTNLQPPSGDGIQTKRILGIIPNFRAVNADVKLPPQSVKDKFLTATQDSFDYSSIVLPSLIALESYERNTTPEFGTGGVGYGRYLWHSVADQTIENYLVEFIVPVATHEDTRYYTLGRGGFVKRAGYSLSRIVITRSDSAEETFNISEVVGAGAEAGISTLYYPSSERTIGKVGAQWGTSLAIDAGSFLVREFWPDVSRKLTHMTKSN